MTGSPLATPSRVLAVLTESGPQTALQHAAAYARHKGAALEVMACLSPPPNLAVLAQLTKQTPDALIADRTARFHSQMEAYLKACPPDQRPVPYVTIGQTFIEIIRRADALNCDLILKMAEPRCGPSRLFLASTDQHLLRKCPAPVWLLTPDAQHPPHHILAAVDLDLEDAAEPETLNALNHAVLDAACAVADREDALVTLLHAWDAPGEGLVWAFSDTNTVPNAADLYVNAILESRQTAMTRFLRESQKRHPKIQLRPCLSRGTPEAAIHAQIVSGSVDLVVMGTVARTGLKGFYIGNTAETILNSLQSPVLAIKPKGFVSPIQSAGP